MLPAKGLCDSTMAGARVDASLMEAIEIAEKLGDDAIQGITRPIGVINGSPVTEKRVVNSQGMMTHSFY